jgi:putative oxidoreductase
MILRRSNSSGGLSRAGQSVKIRAAGAKGRQHNQGTIPMLRIYPAISITGSTGLLAVRLVMGAAFMLHGWPMIQNPLHWMDPYAPTPPPAALQAAAAVSEFVGGAAIILGLFTPLAALGLAATMIAGLAMVHLPHHDPFVGKPGQPSFELAAIYLAVSILLLLAGPGRWSLDAMFFGSRTPREP